MGLKFKKLSLQQNKFQLIWTLLSNPNQPLNPNCLNHWLRQNESSLVYCIRQTSIGFKSKMFADIGSPRCYLPIPIDKFKLSQVEVGEPGHFYKLYRMECGLGQSEFSMGLDHQMKLKMCDSTWGSQEASINFQSYVAIQKMPTF